jgi:polysaccharide export outer membrane protein
MRGLLLVALACLTAACASTPPLSPSIRTGSNAYALMPAAAASSSDTALADYRIGALDTLDVTVFEEPDLSAKAIEVDASGQIALPLVGTVQAKGKTASELANELEKLFGAKYLRNPEVTVSVASSVSQKVSIQGEVVQPGVYQLTGPTTLLDVLSLAKGETDIAKLDQVVVFRNINGQRMGAVFNVDGIRRGEAADPVIQGNDLVVVGYSAASKLWQNIIHAAPLLGIFTRVTTPVLP